MKEVIIAPAVINAYKSCRSRRDYHIDIYPCAEKLSAAIRSAEGRATVRTITPEDVIDALAEIENALSIPKKSMEDLIVYSIDPNHQGFPNAYKFTPLSTQFTALFHGGKWRVTNITRQKCNNTFCTVSHTEKSCAALVERFTNL